MIKLLGTSHISPEAIEGIKKEIEKGPDCVAAELDMARYQALKSDKKRRSSGSPFFRFLGWMQRSLGKKTGVFPGEEMLTAIKKAKENEIETYLIDQPINETLGDIKNISLKGKLKLILSSIGFFKPVKIDLNKVPPIKMVKKVIKHLKTHSPEIYRTLVDKRNRGMTKSLIELDKQYDEVLAVVGIGHVPGIKRLLEEEGIEVEIS